MTKSSFTDEQLLNLVNNTITKKTEFNIEDFTGGSIQITSTNNHQLLKFRVSLFFGYQNRNAIARTIDIKEDYLSIWQNALLLKTKSMQVSTNGMDLSELNELMNISPSSNKVEVVSNKVVSKGSNTVVLTSYDVDSQIIARDLYDKICSVNPTFKGDWNKWTSDIEKMLRIDGRTLAEAQDCLEWIYSKGTFWIPNIMSGKKLREKFDQMNMQSRTKTNDNKNMVDDIYSRGLTANQILEEMEKQNANS